MLIWILFQSDFFMTLTVKFCSTVHESRRIHQSIKILYRSLIKIPVKINKSRGTHESLDRYTFQNIEFVRSYGTYGTVDLMVQWLTRTTCPSRVKVTHGTVSS